MVYSAYMAKKNDKTYSVTQATTLVKVALEDSLPPRMTIVGEISGWKQYNSGHCYFSLKDEGSILPCVMWKSSFAKTKFAPENGMSILATGNIDVYPQQGKYQFYADRLAPVGAGKLQLAFDQLVQKLREEGLFDDQHKKPLPTYPMRIGMVTSASGAAVMDIADSIYNRWPCAKLLLYPVRVQGEGAADEIAKAIRKVNLRNKELALDILIVGRGGGSLEDLWAFNEEVVARAIFKSKIPIISAVGHEVDFTVADFVADARASTPTKAGIIAVPDRDEILERLDGAKQRLRSTVDGKAALSTQNLETILASAVFRNPYYAVNNASQRIDELSARLGDSARRIFLNQREKLNIAQQRIARIEPHRLLGAKTVDLDRLKNACRTAANNRITAEKSTLNGLQMRLNRAFETGLTKNKLQIATIAGKLTGLNPKSVLQRGYSITTNKNTGNVVTKAADIKTGELLITELSDQSRIESTVKSTISPKKREED
jgi:exodeoxyribonuclease VII large subunit